MGFGLGFLFGIVCVLMLTKCNCVKRFSFCAAAPNILKEKQVKIKEHKYYLFSVLIKAIRNFRKESAFVDEKVLNVQIEALIYH